jgi:hypothetical protein
LFLFLPEKKDGNYRLSAFYLKINKINISYLLVSLFSLRPITHNVGDLIEQLRAEDLGIDRVVLKTVGMYTLHCALMVHIHLNLLSLHYAYRCLNTYFSRKAPRIKVPIKTSLY